MPMTEPHQTASGVITESPLVLTDILTDTGVSGHSIVFTYTPAALKPTAELIQNFEALVQGDEVGSLSRSLSRSSSTTIGTRIETKMRSCRQELI